MKKYYKSLLPLLLFASTAATAQVHANGNLWYNNGAEVYVGAGTLVTVSGDVTNNGAGITPVDAHLDNNGFMWVQGNLTR